jgi:hypothetical protein
LQGIPHHGENGQPKIDLVVIRESVFPNTCDEMKLVQEVLTLGKVGVTQ